MPELKIDQKPIWTYHPFLSIASHLMIYYISVGPVYLHYYHLPYLPIEYSFSFFINWKEGHNDDDNATPAFKWNIIMCVVIGHGGIFTRVCEMLKPELPWTWRMVYLLSLLRLMPPWHLEEETTHNEAWGTTRMSGGYQARPKIHVKRVFFHSRALYVCNMNRISNSCKIGLKEYDFFWRS